MKPLFSVFEQSCSWAEKHGFSCISQPETGSTNTDAKNSLGTDSPEFCIFLTDTQKKGRGRGDNVWSQADKGTCLLSSWSFSMAKRPQHITGPLIGLALFRAAREAWGSLEWSLKAPNDLYLQKKKVAGLLVESIDQGDIKRLIVGLGFNVFDHPPDVEHADHLCSNNGLGAELTVQAWWRFLDSFHHELKMALIKSTQIAIEEADREGLLTALNLYPLKDSTIIDVTENGDLVTDRATLPWQQI